MKIIRKMKRKDKNDQMTKKNNASGKMHFFLTCKIVILLGGNFGAIFVENMEKNKNYSKNEKMTMRREK